MKPYVTVLLMGLLAIGSAEAQIVEPGGRMLLNVDYARFRYDSTNSYLELYFAVYPRLLTLRKEDGVYRGSVLITTRLLDRMTKEYVLDRTSLLPIIVRDTSESSYRSTMVTLSGHAVPPGFYMLEVMAVDSLQPAQRDSLVTEVDITGEKESFWVSDIELCSSIKGSGRSDDPFYKNSLEVVPNPTVVFGIATHPVMFYYLELYNIAPPKTYEIHTAIVNAKGDTIKRSSKSRSYSVPNAVEAAPINVSAIESGKNLLLVAVTDETGNEIARSVKSFYSFNPHIRSAEVSAASLKANELAGLSEDELDDEFNKAQYVALKEDIDRYSKLAGADAKREFLAQFWSAVESGEKGRMSIGRSRYLRRISEAGAKFRAFRREGWRTDRGRVYVLNAAPDEVERFPSSVDAKPYEIWHYYQIESGVDFVFVDRTGFGDYILVHSTKRGEIRDETWERYLR